VKPARACDACGRCDKGTVAVGVILDGLLVVTARLCPLHADDVRGAVKRAIVAAEAGRGKRERAFSH